MEQDHSTPQPMRISQVAARVGVTARAIRYYEQLGLLQPSTSSPGGFRLYTERDVRRLLLIQRFKDLGLTLDDIRVVLSPGPGTPRDKATRIAFSEKVLTNELAAVNERVQVFLNRKQQIESALTALEACRRCNLSSCSPGCAKREAYV